MLVKTKALCLHSSLIVESRYYRPHDTPSVRWLQESSPLGLIRRLRRNPRRI